MYCDFSIYKKAIELYRPKSDKTGFLLYKEYINHEKHDNKNPFKKFDCEYDYTRNIKALVCFFESICIYNKWYRYLAGKPEEFYKLINYDDSALQSDLQTNGKSSFVEKPLLNRNIYEEEHRDILGFNKETVKNIKNRFSMNKKIVYENIIIKNTKCIKKVTVEILYYKYKDEDCKNVSIYNNTNNKDEIKLFDKLPRELLVQDIYLKFEFEKTLDENPIDISYNIIYFNKDVRSLICNNPLIIENNINELFGFVRSLMGKLDQDLFHLKEYSKGVRIPSKLTVYNMKRKKLYIEDTDTEEIQFIIRNCESILLLYKYTKIKENKNWVYIFESDEAAVKLNSFIQSLIYSPRFNYLKIDPDKFFRKEVLLTYEIPGDLKDLIQKLHQDEYDKFISPFLFSPDIHYLKQNELHPELKTVVKYRPGGEGYLECKESFYSLANSLN